MKNREIPAGYTNTDGIAKLLNITTRRVQQLTKEGIIRKESTTSGEYYSVAAVLAMYLQNLKSVINEREEKSERQESAEDKKIEAEIKSKRAKAGKVELALEDLQKNVHSAADVKAANKDLILVINENIEEMGAELACELGNITAAPEVSRIIEKRVFNVLEKLANYRFIPDEAREREKKYASKIKNYIKE